MGVGVGVSVGVTAGVGVGVSVAVGVGVEELSGSLRWIPTSPFSLSNSPSPSAM